MNNKKECIGMANLFESKLTSSEDFVLYDGKKDEKLGGEPEYGINKVYNKDEDENPGRYIRK